jgi:hypothetical protein
MSKTKWKGKKKKVKSSDMLESEDSGESEYSGKKTSNKVLKTKKKSQPESRRHESGNSSMDGNHSKKQEIHRKKSSTRGKYNEILEEYNSIPYKNKREENVSEKDSNTSDPFLEPKNLSLNREDPKREKYEKRIDDGESEINFIVDPYDNISLNNVLREKIIEYLKQTEVKGSCLN